MILGISGKIGTGKSTLADCLVKKAIIDNNRHYVRTSFGNLLKCEVSEKFNIPLHLCFTQEGKKTLITHPELPGGKMVLREILQWWGTDIRRAEDPDYWVKKMDGIIGKNSPSTLFFIDDVRFPNEAELTRVDNLLARLEPYPGWEPGPYANHESEVALDDYDKFSYIFSPAFNELSLIADVLYTNL